MLIETATKSQLHAVHVVLLHDNEEEKAFYDALDFEEEEGAVDSDISTTYSVRTDIDQTELISDQSGAVTEGSVLHVAPAEDDEE